MELLLVVAIIGVLVGLIFPAIVGGMSSAMETQCQNHIRQLAAVIRDYCQQNEGSFPLGGTSALASSANDWLFTRLTAAGDPQFNKGVLVRNRYVARVDMSTRDELAHDADIFYCPVDISKGLLRPSMPAKMKETIRTNVKRAPTSYVINGSITYGDLSWSPDKGTQIRSRKFSEFDSTDFLFIEAGDDSTWNTYFAIPDASTWQLTDRHRNGGFVSCMGGHVEWMMHDDPNHNDNDFKAEIDKVKKANPWYKTTEDNAGNRWNPG